MKTLMMLTAMLVASLFVQAQKQGLNYVITKTDTLYFKQFKTGALQTKGKLLNNQKVTLSNADILAYSKNGCTMRKLPVYLKGKKTDCCAMMELVGNANGLSIYKYTYYNGSKDCEDAIFNFYRKDICVNTQKNPDLIDIKDFVMNYNPNQLQLFTLE